MKTRFILASASPRRKELLEMAGLDFEVVPAGIDESFRDGETPHEHVLRLSREKARAVAGVHPEAWVLGADTIVLIDGEVLGKPGTKQEAKAMLGKLSGREHRVVTGFTLLKGRSATVATEAVESVVVFKKLTTGDIECYTSTGEPYDKAGGYAAQGKGASLIKEIRGSYTNVVGLPLCEVMEALKTVGAAKVC